MEVSDNVKLDRWELMLYQAGYRAALVEANRVAMSHAMANTSSPACDPLTQVALEIVQLGDICDASDAVKH